MVFFLSKIINSNRTTEKQINENLSENQKKEKISFELNGELTSRKSSLHLMPTIIFHIENDPKTRINCEHFLNERPTSNISIDQRSDVREKRCTEFRLKNKKIQNENEYKVIFTNHQKSTDEPICIFCSTKR